MLHAALLTACLLVGQVPPPPPPRNLSPGGSQTPTKDQPPSAPQAQREWLFAHLIVDMQAQGKLDAQKAPEIEPMLKNMSPSQLGYLVQYYQERKAQVASWELAQAEANLRRLKAYRDQLKHELQFQTATRQQERALTANGSWLAARQIPWVTPNFFAAPLWPYYAPRRHHAW